MKFCCCLLFFFFFRFCTAQKLTYNVVLFGNKIGQTIVERNIKSDTVNYTLNSASETVLFWVHRKVTLHYDIAYKQDQLLSAYSKNVRNEEVISIQVNWLGSKYLVKKNSGISNLNIPITCSSVKYYYEEPCPGDEVFSERVGQFIPLKKTAENEYECALPEGVTNIYRYKNGKLIEVEMKKGWISAYLKLAG